VEPSVYRLPRAGEGWGEIANTAAAHSFHDETPHPRLNTAINSAKSPATPPAIPVVRP